MDTKESPRGRRSPSVLGGDGPPDEGDGSATNNAFQWGLLIAGSVLFLLGIAAIGGFVGTGTFGGDSPEIGRAGSTTATPDERPGGTTESPTSAPTPTPTAVGLSGRTVPSTTPTTTSTPTETPTLTPTDTPSPTPEPKETPTPHDDDDDDPIIIIDPGTSTPTSSGAGN